MDDKIEQKEETTTEETPKEDKGDGDKPKENSLIDDTNLATKRLEEATKASREERLTAEESYSKMKLGGQTDAGVQKEKPKEETPKEYNDRIDKEISEGKHAE